MATITKPGIIYLQKDKFQLYSPFLGSILEFRFVPEIVRDLDVINVKLLGTMIQLFVNNNKVPPSNLLIVLCDNAYFVKDFVFQNPSQTQTKAQQPLPSQEAKVIELQKQADFFVEHIPYDNVVSKTFPLKNGMRVCAANKDLYGDIALAFEALGFIIDAVIPGLVLGNNFSARPVMDGGMVNIILQKANELKKYDFLTQKIFQPITKQAAEAFEADPLIEENLQSKKPNKKRLILLIGVFTVLTIVLIIVFIQSQIPPPPQASPTQLPPIVTNPTATITPAENGGDTAPPTALQTQNRTVQIVNASTSAAIAQDLRTQLEKYTFKNVALQPQSSVASSGTVVSFSGNTVQSVRNAVLKEVRKFKSDISVQEKQDGAFDITILLGK